MQTRISNDANNDLRSHVFPHRKLSSPQRFINRTHTDTEPHAKPLMTIARKNRGNLHKTNRHLKINHVSKQKVF